MSVKGKEVDMKVVCTMFILEQHTQDNYEHSIGVAYLAGEYARMLQKRYRCAKIDKSTQTSGDSEDAKEDQTTQKDKSSQTADADDRKGEDTKTADECFEITDKDILCVEIAGLCHDLGHGPFSHLFDEYLEELKPEVSHEKLSQDILEKVIFSEECLKKDFEAEGLTSDDVERIKRMIHPGGKYKATDGRLFLFQIVANKTSGIDVDKWDYYTRDCHYMGLEHEFDYRRLMQMSRILKHKGQYQLCYNKREIPSIIGMFRTRCSLHEKGYKHRRGIAMNHMICTAISEVMDIKLITITNDKDKSEKEQSSLGSVDARDDLNDRCKSEEDLELSINDILGSLDTPEGLKRYLKLNDGILYIIENTSLSACRVTCNNEQKKESVEDVKEKKKKLVKAKKMISNLHNDEYFILIQAGSEVEKGPEVPVKDIIEELKKESIEILEENIFSKKVKLSYGSEGKKAGSNPCEMVLVYDENSTSESNYDLDFIKDEDIDPLFRPKSFGREKFWYYYSKRVKDNKEDIKRVIVELHKQKKDSIQQVLDEADKN